MLLSGATRWLGDVGMISNILILQQGQMLKHLRCDQECYFCTDKSVRYRYFSPLLSNKLPLLQSKLFCCTSVNKMWEFLLFLPAFERGHASCLSKAFWALLHPQLGRQPDIEVFKKTKALSKPKWKIDKHRQLLLCRMQNWQGHLQIVNISDSNMTSFFLT